MREDRLVLVDPERGVRANYEVAGQFYSGIATYRAEGKAQMGAG